MQFCKICGELLAPGETSRGTCKECETAVSNLIVQKFSKGFYSRKVRLKLH